MSLVKGCCLVHVNINVREGLENNNGECIFCGIITFITHKKKNNKAGNESGEAAREVIHEGLFVSFLWLLGFSFQFEYWFSWHNCSLS